jgi:1,2-diacylglycerol 3-alpha-glucosyltransferase
MAVDTKKVFIVCTGLGRVNRGFETFAQECFDALKKNDKSLEFILLRGAKNGKLIDNEYVCWNMSRQSTTRLLGPDNAYRFENMTFVLSLIPKIVHDQPAIILISDFFAACYLMHLKKCFGFTYKVLFSNGGPSGPPYIFDHIHQLSDFYFREAIAYGELPVKHTVIPYGFSIENAFRFISIDERTLLKKTLGIATDKRIILSVGAVNASHKRMNYLIDEVAKLDETWLIILGQFGQETNDIIRRANQKLPNRVIIKTVKQESVGLYYACADLFVLASLREGFGRSYIEALAAGLPVCAHDYEMARELLLHHGYYADFTKENALATLISDVLKLPLTDQIRKERHSFAYNRFSWQSLKNDYLSMITQVSSMHE